jgi:hypothetical protein
MCGEGAVCAAASTPEKSIAPKARNFVLTVQVFIISAHLSALRIVGDATYITSNSLSLFRNAVWGRLEPEKHDKNKRSIREVISVAKFLTSDAW